jgi:membrane-associated protein
VNAKQTGFVFLPFLPGDSLLFVTGALTAQPQFGLSVTLMWVLLTVAAVAGDALNYAAGHSLGPAVFHLVDDAPAATSDWKSLYTKLTRPRASFKERFHALVRHGLKKDHLTSAQAFYAKHGGKAIVLARFFPVLRSFAPFVAGVTDMAYPSFLRYNCIGGFAWITGSCWRDALSVWDLGELSVPFLRVVPAFLLAGYYLGHIPGVQSNFKLIILLLIAVSFIPLIITSYKSKKEAIDAKEVKAKAANSSYQRPVFVAEV